MNDDSGHEDDKSQTGPYNAQFSIDGRGLPGPC